MYTFKISQHETHEDHIFSSTSNCFIPLAEGNSDYQRVLDDIIEQGASCFEGDIPTDLQTAADAKQKEYYESIIERNKSITFEKVLQIDTDDRDGSEVENWVISEEEKEWKLLVEKAKNYIEANS